MANGFLQNFRVQTKIDEEDYDIQFMYPHFLPFSDPHRYPRVRVYNPTTYTEHQNLVSLEFLKTVIREGFCVEISMQSPEDRMMELEHAGSLKDPALQRKHRQYDVQIKNLED